MLVERLFYGLKLPTDRTTHPKLNDPIVRRINKYDDNGGRTVFNRHDIRLRPKTVLENANSDRNGTSGAERREGHTGVLRAIKKLGTIFQKEKPKTTN